MKKLVLGGVVLALVLAAAGCGGGGSDQLTKEEYASQLNAICNDVEPKFNALNISDMASFKEKGDEAVEIVDDAVERFKELDGPDELTSASGTFNDSAEEVADDFKKANEAAKNDDQAEYDAALASYQNHTAENDEAAKEIGADDCVSGS